MELFIIILIIVFIAYIYYETNIKNKNQYKDNCNIPEPSSEYTPKQNAEQTIYTQSPPEQSISEEKKEEISDFSYMPYKKRLLLTKTEYAFYVVLMRECNKRKLLVCPKVRLEDLVYVTDKKHPYKYRGYVKSRHVDFVITDIRLNALAAIELDDPSHDTYKVAKTDRFKNELFKTINVPLIRIKTGTDYETQVTVIFDQLNFNVNTTMSKTQP